MQKCLGIIIKYMNHGVVFYSKTFSLHSSFSMVSRPCDYQIGASAAVSRLGDHKCAVQHNWACAIVISANNDFDNTFRILTCAEVAKRLETKLTAIYVYFGVFKCVFGVTYREHVNAADEIELCCQYKLYTFCELILMSRCLIFVKSF